MMTKDEVGELSQMEITTRLNGVMECDGGFAVHGFDELIEFCSTFIELEPGDVIVTGTWVLRVNHRFLWTRVMSSRSM